jgi:predicted phage terminase large subunit-like protein
VVVLGSVSTPEMIAKTDEAFQLSDNLGSVGGTIRVYGTRYAYGDSYEGMLASCALKARIYACTVDGTDNFEPDNCVLMSPEVLRAKRTTQGPYIFSAQMLLRPQGDTSMGFKRSWLAYMEGQPHAKGLDVYLLCDPAHSKKGSDYTVMMVIGIGSDGVYRLLDMIRDRLNLTERITALFEMWGRWRPRKTGYERYGLQADIEAIKREQHERNIVFPITELGGSTPKVDRIRRLVPLFESGKILLPYSLHYTQYDGKTVDLIRAFVEEEFVTFPAGAHDDMLDCFARILDPDLKARVPLSDAERGARGRVPKVIGSAEARKRGLGVYARHPR